MTLEWSATALADLDRFAVFLHDRHPHPAKIVAAEILAKGPYSGRESIDRPADPGGFLNIASWCLKC